MPTPDPCQFISASGTRSGNQLSIKIAATHRPVGCILVVGEFAYRATIPLSAGTYSVEVMHEYPGTGWATEVVRKATVLVY
jgi:hypothetical protein